MRPDAGRPRILGGVSAGLESGSIGAVDDLAPERRDPGVTRRLSARERRIELLLAAVFAVAAGAMLAGSQGGWDDPLSAVLLTGTYALVSRISFQLGPGLVGATQLAFVPMVFLLPPLAVPALVAAGAVLAVLPEIVSRRAHPERAVVAIADCWYAIGPAIVFELMDPSDPGWEDLDVFLLALFAQFAVDFAASTLRERVGAGISVRELAPVMGLVYVVDVLLSPIGFLAVLASGEHRYAYLLAVPPGALLALVAGERRKRIERELALGRAYRRSTVELQRARLRVGEALASSEDRAALERVLLTAVVEAVEADGGRLTAGDVERLAIGEVDGSALALSAPLGRGSVLTVARAARGFSEAETTLFEDLAAQVAVSLENVRLREAERAAAEAIRELSTPVLVVRERLLIVPLVGTLDSDRAAQLTDELLVRIRAGRAQVVVIDVTGVPVIDSVVAGQLVSTVQACALLGASVVVTGLSSEITQALVTTGVDLRAIHAVADLQRGIEEAERLLNDEPGQEARLAGATNRRGRR
jgi:rsbT co-antagonist protein RsbR